MNIQKSRLSNMWQTFLLVLAIIALGFNLNVKFQESVFSESQIKEIAISSAEQVIYNYKQEIALTDAGDLVRGWIEDDSRTMREYVQHCYENKTRVYKGGLMLIDNTFETRTLLSDKYGERVVKDLVDVLIDFK